MLEKVRYSGMLRYFIAFLLIVLIADGALASRVPQPAKQTPITKEQIEQVRNSPKALLDKFPNGGPGLASQVARLVVADPTLVEPILSTTPDMTPPQASAVGAGMARAARTLSARQPAVSKAIKQKVEEAGSRRMQTTFRAIGPDNKALEAARVPDLQPLLPLYSQDVGQELPLGISKVGPNQEFGLKLKAKPLGLDKDGTGALTSGIEYELQTGSLQAAALGAQVMMVTNPARGGLPLSRQVIPPTPVIPVPPIVAPVLPVIPDTPVVNVVRDNSSSNGVAPVSP